MKTVNNLKTARKRMNYKACGTIDVKHMSKDIMVALTDETKRICADVFGNPSTLARLNVIDQKINLLFDDMSEGVMIKILRDLKDKWGIGDTDIRCWVVDKWAIPMYVHYIKMDPRINEGAKELLYHCVQLAKYSAYATEHVARGIVYTTEFRCFLNARDMEVMHRVPGHPYTYEAVRKEEPKEEPKKTTKPATKKTGKKIIKEEEKTSV